MVTALVRQSVWVHHEMWCNDHQLLLFFMWCLIPNLLGGGQTHCIAQQPSTGHNNFQLGVAPDHTDWMIGAGGESCNINRVANVDHVRFDKYSKVLMSDRWKAVADFEQSFRIRWEKTPHMATTGTHIAISPPSVLNNLVLHFRAQLRLDKAFHHDVDQLPCWSLGQGVYDTYRWDLVVTTWVRNTTRITISSPTST